jgi:acyl-CoA hydrolase
MQNLKAKTVAASAVNEQTYKVFPNDLNANDTVFGGLVMSILDRAAAVVAERHSERTCVTVSIDAMHFLAPAKRGDILIFHAALNRAWRTSMEIGARVEAENYKTGERKHILSAYFTFVALDDQNVPTPIPAVIPKTNVEKRRFKEADIRRANRHLHAEERSKGRE